MTPAAAPPARRYDRSACFASTSRSGRPRLDDRAERPGETAGGHAARHLISANVLCERIKRNAPDITDHRRFPFISIEPRTRGPRSSPNQHFARQADCPQIKPKSASTSHLWSDVWMRLFGPMASAKVKGDRSAATRPIRIFAQITVTPTRCRPWRRAKLRWTAFTHCNSRGRLPGRKKACRFV